MKYIPIGLLALLAIAGCGGGGTTNVNASHSYVGTQSPGDVWSWQITETSFEATNETLGLHYSGLNSVLPTGFMKLEVAVTNDPDVTIGQAAYALELPGTALLIKPAGPDTRSPIIASSLGKNPRGPQVSFNFVAVGGSAFQATDQAYGHVTYTVSGNNYTGTSHRFQINTTPLPDGLSTLTGNDGYMTDPNGQNGSTATGAMTPSGVCVLDYGPGNGGIIGVIQPSSNVNLADLASRNFRGFLINAGKTQCVAVTPNGDGTLHGRGYENPTGVETGTFDNGSGVTITFLAQVAPGEVPITLTTSGGTENLVCAINLVAGKYMLFCFGVGQDSKPYNVLLVEN